MATAHPGWAWTLVGTDTPTAGGGVAAPIGVMYLNTATGVVHVKTGAADTAWTKLSPTAQRFTYVATGAELAQFAVPLPAARANATYLVQVTMAAAGGSAVAFKGYRVCSDLKTTTQFQLELPVAPELGDIFYITVDDPT